MSNINRKKITIDANGKPPGRLASEIARYLMGKHKISYVLNRDLGDKVEVTNAAGVVFTGKKLEQKEYKHHSMHPGGLKRVPAKKQVLEDPEFVVRHAVSMMLPRNKFRTARLRRLHFV